MVLKTQYRPFLSGVGTCLSCQPCFIRFVLNSAVHIVHRGEIGDRPATVSLRRANSREYQDEQDTS